MTTVRQLRKAALALPETAEGTHFKMVAFTVAGKGFASVTKEGVVQLYMSDEFTKQILERFPAAERLTRMGKPLGVRVALADVNGMELNSLVRKSWLSRAPKRMAAAQREAAVGEAPIGPDALPPSIGKPATRALLGAGVKDLIAVSAKAEAELLALHGVGPRAVKLLGEALRERGMDFRAP